MKLRQKNTKQNKTYLVKNLEKKKYRTFISSPSPISRYLESLHLKKNLNFFFSPQKERENQNYQDTILSIYSYKLDDDIYVCLLFFTLLQPLFILFVVLYIIYAQTILFYYIQDPHHWKNSQTSITIPTNPSTIIMYINHPITILKPSINAQYHSNYVHFYFQNNVINALNVNFSTIQLNPKSQKISKLNTSFQQVDQTTNSKFNLMSKTNPI
ncbi:unnamed protein product [Paramecium sonneborni]|uniref:Transmembrane protein n=1 Tax=Paramecium sonneborni TaxID=65129 RepID=A0A8S1P958_9CILI|nr:unnamed protein product [Paramecium sonneborni]